METAPRGGYGESYSGEARLFLRGLARESGWLTLTGPREGQPHSHFSSRTKTPAGESHWPFAASDLYSISVFNSSSVAYRAVGEAGEAAFVEFAACLKGDDAK